MIDFKKFENKKVVITTVKDSVYKGVLTPKYKKRGKEKVKLRDMVVCNKDGSYKAISGNRSNNMREFNCGSIKNVETL